jgi:hypothetical protein
MKTLFLILATISTVLMNKLNKPVTKTLVSPTYEWKRMTQNADFPKSYNFQLFSTDDKIWAFHPQGSWFSTDGISWTKSPLTNIINNVAFLDYVQFDKAILGLGYFEGNIENFTLCTPIHKTKDFKTWKQVAKTSNLPKRFFYHPVVFKGKIWIIGGTDGHKKHDDVWNSTDGISWQKVADNMPFGGVENRQFVVLNNKLYMLGNDVWSSDDGINWKQETKQITDAQLFGYAAVVFDNKIWLLGCNRNQQFTSQVLVSEDGKKWTAQNAPWSPRGGIAACVHDGKIYMTGGKYGGFADKTGTTTEFIYSNDVWVLEKK